MKKNKLMQIFLLVMLLLNTVLPSLATTVSAAGITKNEQAKAGTGTISAVFFEDLNILWHAVVQLRLSILWVFLLTIQTHTFVPL